MLYSYEHEKRYINSIIRKLRENIYTQNTPLKAVVYKSKEPLNYEDRMLGQKEDIKIGDKWGELFDCAWFHFTGIVPQSFKDKKTVLIIDVGGEGCVYDDEGVPKRGLTSMEQSFDVNSGLAGKRVVQFSERALGNEEISVWVDAGCNDLFGGMSFGGVLKRAEAAVCNDEIRSLFYDFQVLYDLIITLETNSARYGSIMFSLKKACDVLIDFSEDNLKKAKEILHKELSKKGGDASLKINAIGHSHLDLAWLWPIRETKRKAKRTLSTVLDLMERYPDYKFSLSQPQVLQWMYEDCPEFFEKIKAKIMQGRIELVGGWWVESDTNVPSGESLIRQSLYGQEYMQKNFNITSKIMWMPDVFGYTQSLPQIMKGCGMDYFMTQKLSWSEHNKFPHQTFNWVGTDKTSVLAHMPPEECYNSAANPSMAKWLERNHRDNGVAKEALMLFGIGDGGGGPGPEHLERLERMKDLNGIAPVSIGSCEEFFKRLEENKENYKTWEGELYLEKHQGTYTSQAKNKWYNRKLEYMFRELEFACSLLNEKIDVDELYKEFLLYQFHDILPGSSIKRVYDECLKRYEAIYSKVKELIDNQYEKLSKKFIGAKKGKLVINSLPFDREEYVNINGKDVKVTVPKMGYTVAFEDEQKFDVYANVNVLENSLLKVVFNMDGSIKSIYDKVKEKEVLLGSQNGQLSVYEDEGDAWDFSFYYRDRKVGRFEIVGSKSYVSGAKAIMKQHYKFNKSTLTQTITLYENSKRLDFACEADWQETNKMLRVSFDVNVMANEAEFDIQFGNIKRSLHNNTTWDYAKFEQCGHKYAKIAQPDYSVALLNDCKYGYYAKEHTLDLNLLRSCMAPCVDQDKGEHKFVYALYCEEIGKDNDVLKEAYKLNVPVNIVDVSCDGKFDYSFIETDTDDVIIETVKPSHVHKDTVIRMYEPKGCDRKIKLKPEFDYIAVYECNMLEDKKQKLESLEISLKPFEIKTLRFER